MKIALIEPFFTGSHQTWAEEYQRYSNHEVRLFTLPGRHWKWRMHGGAVALAREFLDSGLKADLVLATDMLDLSLFTSLVRKTHPGLPVALYFHENQITYPWSEDDPDPGIGRDNHYGFINYSSALAADAVFFNSQYHKNAFLAGLPNFLNQFPDYNLLDTVKKIEAKSEVLPLGLDLLKLDKYQTKSDLDRPLILWNHRWEYDKNPDAFFRALFKLKEEGLPFYLVILGKNYTNCPAIFEEAKTRLKDEILHFGFSESIEEYARWLWKADILPATGIQDFFGISVVEAIYCGCYPLLPDRLAYPEHIPENMQNQHLYKTEEDFFAKLRTLVAGKENFSHIETLRNFVARYDWSILAKKYDDKLRIICE